MVTVLPAQLKTYGLASGVMVNTLGPWTLAWSIPSENVTMTSWVTGTLDCPAEGVRAVTDGPVLSIAKSLSLASHPVSPVVSRAHARTLTLLGLIDGSVHKLVLG